ncbi:sigma-70 region 2 domain protein [Thermotoga sp. Mc24]|uniref:sigma factor n=1 Tax=Thermotoga sp. Mc24 TaxID=1231241 RepID=UPI00054453D3|nr:sigma factor [Thermotoga sp. Mc24]KHC90350.1 sigma-70 region 2 domain protein [Thermotoga sp. Mc24]
MLNHTRRKLENTKDEDLSIDELFEKYQNEIRKKAGFFFKKFKEKISSFEDLYQAICCIFCYARKTWNKNKGTFAAHLKSTINRKVIDLIQGIPLPGCSNAPFDILKTEYKSRCKLEDFEEKDR